MAGHYSHQKRLKPNWVACKIFVALFILAIYIKLLGAYLAAISHLTFPPDQASEIKMK
jgi:hypothetical protein